MSLPILSDGNGPILAILLARWLFSTDKEMFAIPTDFTPFSLPGRSGVRYVRQVVICRLRPHEHDKYLVLKFDRIRITINRRLIPWTVYT